MFRSQHCASSLHEGSLAIAMALRPLLSPMAHFSLEQRTTPRCSGTSCLGAVLPAFSEPGLEARARPAEASGRILQRIPHPRTVSLLHR